MRDIGPLYVGNKDIKDFLKAKNSCILTRYVDDYIHKYSPFISYYADTKVARLAKLE